MNFPCAVEYDLRRYERDQERLEALGERTNEILADMVADAIGPGGKYDLLDGENILEAFGDADRQTINNIGRFVATGDGVALVELMRRVSKAYWTDYAESVFEDDARNQAMSPPDEY